MLDIILATRDIYFEKALREVFGTVSSRIRYIEDAISDRRRVQSGCVFRSIRSRIGIEVRSAIRIHSINRELNFFYRFLTRFFAAF
ncbi:hypothetical protein PIG48_28455, partial [Escherichia coli]|nr:hypothetical protein [Escherichia coli]